MFFTNNHKKELEEYKKSLDNVVGQYQSKIISSLNLTPQSMHPVHYDIAEIGGYMEAIRIINKEFKTSYMSNNLHKYDDLNKKSLKKILKKLPLKD